LNCGNADELKETIERVRTILTNNVTYKICQLAVDKDCHSPYSIRSILLFGGFEWRRKRPHGLKLK